MNVLFVCSRNQWRSPTAEAIWRRVPNVAVRSAGTSSNARRRLALADLQWADIVLVVEEVHRARIRADFRDHVKHKPIHVLDIPDYYQFMDTELVDILKQKTTPLIVGAAED